MMVFKNEEDCETTNKFYSRLVEKRRLERRREAAYKEMAKFGNEAGLVALKLNPDNKDQVEKSNHDWDQCQKEHEIKEGHLSKEQTKVLGSCMTKKGWELYPTK